MNADSSCEDAQIALLAFSRLPDFDFGAGISKRHEGLDFQVSLKAGEIDRFVVFRSNNPRIFVMHEPNQGWFHKSDQEMLAAAQEIEVDLRSLLSVAIPK